MISEFYFANFYDKEILSNPDIKQRVLMMTDETKDKKLELTKEQQKQIARNFAIMYYGLTTVHWCDGAPLGVAQQKALEQMSSFVKTKSNPEHPMNKYLRALDNQYRREISERIMRGKYSDCKIEINSELAKKWAKLATERFRKSLKFMLDMYKEYDPEKATYAQTGNKIIEKTMQNTYNQMKKVLENPTENERAA